MVMFNGGADNGGDVDGDTDDDDSDDGLDATPEQPHVTTFHV